MTEREFELAKELDTMLSFCFMCLDRETRIGCHPQDLEEMRQKQDEIYKELKLDKYFEGLHATKSN